MTCSGIDASCFPHSLRSKCHHALEAMVAASNVIKSYIHRIDTLLFRSQFPCHANFPIPYPVMQHIVFPLNQQHQQPSQKRHHISLLYELAITQSASPSENFPFPQTIQPTKQAKIVRFRVRVDPSPQA